MNAHRAIVSALVGFVWLSAETLQAQSAPTSTPSAGAASDAGAATVTAPGTATDATGAAAPAAQTTDVPAAPPAAEAVPMQSPTAAPTSAPVAAAPASSAAAQQAALDTERPPPVKDPAARELGNPKFGTPSDHDDVVGRWAIAYFGVRSVPIADATDPDQAVATPVFGARHWFNDTLGLDVGIGMGYEITGGKTYVDGGDDVNTPQTGVFAFALYAGLPLSLYDAGHFNALVIPELNLGFANGMEEEGVSASGLKEFPRGFTFGAGARIGAEIHLDVIGIPQVAVQLTFGFSLKYTSRTLETESTSGAVSGRNAGSVSIASDATSPKDWLAAGLQLVWYL
jgi:hypothetical protein